MVLGALVGGAGTTTIGCLGGAQIDRFGNVNSTRIEPRPFLVGSGGGNDVASTATENVVVATLTPQRTPADCSYITSPGRAVRALVTDLGLLEKQGDLATAELVLTAVPAGEAPLADRVAPRVLRADGISGARPTSVSSRTSCGRGRSAAAVGSPGLVSPRPVTFVRRRRARRRSTASTATAASNTIATSAPARKRVKP